MTQNSFRRPERPERPQGPERPKGPERPQGPERQKGLELICGRGRMLAFNVFPKTMNGALRSQSNAGGAMRLHLFVLGASTKGWR